MTVELPLLHKQHKQNYHGFAEGNYFTFITIVLSVIVHVWMMKSLMLIHLKSFY